MPMWDYKCLDCKCEFEALILKKSDIAKCPKCKSEHVEKFLVPKSPFNFRLMGSGWYKVAPIPPKNKD